MFGALRVQDLRVKVFGPFCGMRETGRVHCHES